VSQTYYNITKDHDSIVWTHVIIAKRSKNNVKDRSVPIIGKKDKERYKKGKESKRKGGGKRGEKEFTGQTRTNESCIASPATQPRRQLHFAKHRHPNSIL